jgi:hypothetical protein
VAPAAMAAHNGRGRRRPLRRGSTEGVVRFVRDKRRDKVPHLAAILRAKRTTMEKQRRGRSMPAGAVGVPRRRLGSVVRKGGPGVKREATGERRT